MLCWRPLLSALLSILALSAAPAAATVTIAFVDPASFTDLGGLEGNPAENLSDIEAYLRSLGDRYVPAQVTLRIEVLDISLAGRSRWPPRSGWAVRSMTGEADWPRYELRYTVESDGNVATPVEETVVDRNYLRPLEWRYASLTLPFDKRTLEEWFKARFGQRWEQSRAVRG